MITRQIILKKKTPEHIVTQLCNELTRWGKFLASEYTENGTPVITCKFDDLDDFLSVMIALRK